MSRYNNDDDGGFFQDNLKASVKRYEEMLKANDSFFFESDELMDICDYYMAQENLQKAYEVCKYAMTLYAGNNAFRLKEAAVMLKMGKLDSVHEKLRAYEMLYTGDSEMHILFAHYHLAHGEHQEAVHRFKAALDNAEDRTPIYHDLAFACTDIGDFGEACTYMEYFMKAGGGDYMTAQHYIQWLLITDTGKRGLTFFAAQIDDDPYNYLAWLGQAIIQKEMGNLAEAMQSLEYCLVIDDKNDVAFLEYGYVLMQDEQYKHAIKYFHQAYKNNNENFNAIFHTGECFEVLAEYDKARDAYQRTIKQNPAFAPAWYAIGLLLISAERCYEALHYVKKAIEIEADNAEYWFSLGDCEAGLNHYKEAAECYDNVIELDPYYETIWIDYAMLVYDNNELQNAMLLLQKGLKYFPDNAEYLFYISAMQYENGNIQEAYNTLADALSIDYDLHAIIFEMFPAIRNDKHIMRIIEQYKPL